MQAAHPGHAGAAAATRPAGLEIADILRLHLDEARARLALTPAQLGVVQHLITCRPAALGGHLETCDHCDFSRPAYNSCRDRHCPKCQAIRQAQWVALRLTRILPVPHYHVVFTVPGHLRALIKANPGAHYEVLFRAASETLAEFAKDPKWLGAQIGVTAILHTWTRELQFHPHVHCVVTGGGLSADGTRWVQSRGGARFLFPVKALAKVFRGKVLEALRELHLAARSSANLADDTRFVRFIDRLYRMRWVAYAKRPFSGTSHVFSYLGRYTHRVAISNQRLVSMNEDGVRFATKDGRFATLAPLEFIRRFLDHILPSHFVKIRHYGLYASSNVKGRLAMARALLPPETSSPGPEAPKSPGPAPTPSEQTASLLTSLFGADFLRCPACGLGTLKRTMNIPRALKRTMNIPRARWPPSQGPP